MTASVTIPPGYRVGHASDPAALTGCTVILCPPATVGSCEVRGSSPGSRELALLAPERSMQEVHALLLTGGSAFGLAAADGVVQWLVEQNIGYVTPWAKVPIVPAAVVFDLNVGRSDVRPDAAMARRACAAAQAEISALGTLGAGTGVTVGKWRGIDSAMRGGFGAASGRTGDVSMTAVAIVNAVGDVMDGAGRVLAGARSASGGFAADADPTRVITRGRVLGQTNTTLAAVLCHGAFTKLELFRIAQRMHDGMARTILPCHTSYDGDVTFALASGTARADVDAAAELAAALTAEAIRSAVLHADALPTIPSVRSFPHT